MSVSMAKLAALHLSLESETRQGSSEMLLAEQTFYAGQKTRSALDRCTGPRTAARSASLNGRPHF